ncbi:MAG TPA: hypothetical protein VHT51_00505, partial [Micropepsaceae bacterium]|nr:hypothetical protein [Micropepsaceae bacterium]
MAIEFEKWLVVTIVRGVVIKSPPAACMAELSRLNGFAAPESGDLTTVLNLFPCRGIDMAAGAQGSREFIGVVR